MPADGSWDRYEDGRKSSQTHESEIVFRAAGLSVVEAVDVHIAPFLLITYSMTSNMP